MPDIILGIESSCDDTSAAVIKDGYLLSNVLASQDVHKAYGGVIPELASRAHQLNIVPVVSEAINRAGIKPSDITAIAFTRGPGLLGSLLVGTSFAKGFWIPTLKAAPSGFSPTKRIFPPRLIMALCTPLERRKSFTRSAM